jgi:hypothetical protein
MFDVLFVKVLNLIFNRNYCDTKHEVNECVDSIIGAIEYYEYLLTQELASWERKEYSLKVTQYKLKLANY